MIYYCSLKKRTVSENYVDDRIPNSEFTEHYEFELEVLAVNRTKRVDTNPLSTYLPNKYVLFVDIDLYKHDFFYS